MTDALEDVRMAVEDVDSELSDYNMYDGANVVRVQEAGVLCVCLELELRQRADAERTAASGPGRHVVHACQPTPFQIGLVRSHFKMSSETVRRH